MTYKKLDNGSDLCLPVIGFDVTHYDNGTIEVEPMDISRDGSVEHIGGSSCDWFVSEEPETTSTL